MEKFDGMINFGLWQMQVKNVLIQAGIYKALKKILDNGTSNDDGSPWESSGDSVLKS